jgi:hypothetical protein
MAKELDTFSSDNNTPVDQGNWIIVEDSSKTGIENLQNTPYYLWLQDEYKKLAFESLIEELEIKFDENGEFFIENPENTTESIKIEKNQKYSHGFITWIWKPFQWRYSEDNTDWYDKDYIFLYRKFASNTDQSAPQEKTMKFVDIQDMKNELKIKFGENWVESTGEWPNIAWYRKPSIPINRLKKYFPLIKKTIQQRK